MQEPVFFAVLDSPKTLDIPIRIKFPYALNDTGKPQDFNLGAKLGSYQPPVCDIFALKDKFDFFMQTLRNDSVLKSEPRHMIDCVEINEPDVLTIRVNGDEFDPILARIVLAVKYSFGLGVCEPREQILKGRGVVITGWKQII